ncbi:MAG: M14 family metallopeptidase [Acidobacteriota bacterium]|nr:M14 family metallopeptidase [Acidobacteriota bacterium]
MHLPSHRPLIALILAAALALSAAALLAQGGAAAVPSPAGRVPEPRDVFGFTPGDDYKLASHEQIVEYFRALDAASDRIVVEDIGRSTEGRPMILAVISSEANIGSRARYQDIARRLAIARGVDEPTARALAREGKAIVWIDGGLHATEVAGAQHTPELAWWLVSSEDDEARRVRENAILLLMPSMNPDGLDIVRAWYLKNLGTPFETTSPPELYHHYIGHDNNRDWTMFTQVETRAVARQLYTVWYPQVVYNHHQSGPFPSRIWGPPMKDPVNPNLDPLVVSTINQIGEAMRKRFDEEEKPGYSSHMLYDIWWNGSMRGGPDFHNMAGFLTETALYRLATPHCYAPEDIPETFGERHKHLPAKTPSVNYTNPWLGGCWPVRKPVEYMITASRATLDLASRLKEDYLYNIWRMGTRQIARGEKAQGGPYAYVVDLSAQHDPTRTVEFLRTFRIANIEIHQADAPFSAGGKTYPAGTYVVGPQSFRPYVVDLIEPKTFPERRLFPGGPPDPPYDMTGYELSYQMGVTIDRIVEPFVLPSRVVDEIPPAPGGVHGTGTTAFSLAPNQNMGVKALNRLLKVGAKASWAADNTIVLEGITRDAVEAQGRELGVVFTALEARPGGLKAIRAPRIALYRSHRANMDEGWTRWVLEQYEFPYISVSNADVRTGDLSRFDVLLFADESEDAILNGHLAGTMPADFVGGIGMEGAANVRRFVEQGGWLVAWDSAVDFAIRALALPLRNTVNGTRPTEFFIPGALLRITTTPNDPLAAGMETNAVAMFAGSQALQVVPPAAEGSQRAERIVDVYAAFPRQGLLVSGWELGAARYVAGRAAAVRVPVGKGQAVVMSIRPHWRGQPHNTFKLLFNPLFLSTVSGADGTALP